MELEHNTEIDIKSALDGFLLQADMAYTDEKEREVEREREKE